VFREAWIPQSAMTASTSQVLGDSVVMVGPRARKLPTSSSQKDGGPFMDEESRQGPEPGNLGMPQKTISFPYESLAEYKRLVGAGIVDINFPNFVRQSVSHELARYKAEEKQKRGGKKV